MPTEQEDERDGLCSPAAIEYIDLCRLLSCPEGKRITLKGIVFETMGRYFWVFPNASAGDMVTRYRIRRVIIVDDKRSRERAAGFKVTHES